MLQFKAGVSLYGLQPEILWAVDRCVETWIGDCVVTSARGDRHSTKSRHYSGLAVDLRSRNHTPEQIAATVINVRAATGNDYDFIFETNHYHLEYDQKTSMST